MLSAYPSHINPPSVLPQVSSPATEPQMPVPMPMLTTVWVKRGPIICLIPFVGLAGTSCLLTVPQVVEECIYSGTPLQVLMATQELACDTYGNYVIQHVLEHGTDEQR